MAYNWCQHTIYLHKVIKNNIWISIKHKIACTIHNLFVILFQNKLVVFLEEGSPGGPYSFICVYVGVLTEAVGSANLGIVLPCLSTNPVP